MDVIDLTPIAALAILGTIIAVYTGWAWAVAHGVRYRPFLAGFLIASYLLLFLFVETGAKVGSGWLFLANIVLLILAAAAAFVVALRGTEVLHDARGRLGYRGSPAIALVWLLILLLEIYVQQLILGDVTVLNLVVFNGFPSPISVDPSAIAPPQLLVLALVDALFALGTGVAIGYNVGIYAVFARFAWSRPRRSSA